MLPFCPNFKLCHGQRRKSKATNKATIVKKKQKTNKQKKTTSRFNDLLIKHIDGMYTAILGFFCMSLGIEVNILFLIILKNF